MRIGVLLLVISLAVIAAEMTARFVFGLGTPVLMTPHPTVEYLLGPNQDVMRRGVHVATNSFGMRSPEPDIPKRADEFRVLVLGDSVVNGQATTDQSDLATTLLSTDGRLFLNASATSWGPENELAYVDTFGVFDADMMVLVVSSHDAFDSPQFGPVEPQRAPLLALLEIAQKAVDAVFSRAEGSPPGRVDGPSERPLAAIRSLTSILPSCVVLHSTRSEIREGRHNPGYDLILQSVTVPVVETSQYLTEASYVDDIHLSREGQVGLSQAILKCSAITVAPEPTGSRQ